MTFKEKPINKLYAFALAAVFAIALAGCGGGGGSTQAPAEMPDDSRMACEDAGGRWNDNETCTSAADLAAEKLAMERADIKAKLADAQTKVGMVDNDSTAAEVSAADAAIAAAKAAIAAAEDVPAAEKTANTGTVTALEAQLADAKTARMAAMDDAQKAADAAMAATAAKLYAGIGKPMGEVGTYATTDRIAGYAGTNDSQIAVQIGTDPAATAATATLSEDKKTMVADLHGWKGKRYTHSVTTGANKGDMYEAVVYSDVGAPTMGAKFNSGTGDGNVGFALTGDDSDTVTMTDALNLGPRIASPRFTHKAGNYVPKLPANDLTGQDTIPILGTYYGVAGTYICTPATGNGCAVRKAPVGYTFLDPTAWVFKATNPAARVTEMADSEYASYGWWLLTKADGSLTAGAFVDDKGPTPDTLNIAGLVGGSATYRGGAAGKYALSSATGGTNDAGHFTATATLEADFEKDEVTGTIDQFMADGESKDWTVELKKSALFGNGQMIGDRTRDGIVISVAPLAGSDVAQETVWTIGDTAADPSGEWSGMLKDTAVTNTDDSSVPKVATGTFYTEYGTAGRMVGAFGAKKQ